MFRRKKRPQSIKSSLRFYISGLLFATVLVVMLVVYTLYTQVLNHNAESLTMHIVEQSGYDLDNFIGAVNNVCLYIAANDTVIDALSSTVKKNAAHRETIEKLLRYTTEDVLENIQTIYIIGENGIAYSSSFLPEGASNLYKDKVWYNHLLNCTKPAWMQIHKGSHLTGGDEYYMDMGMSIVHPDNADKLGVVYIEIKQSRFQEKLTTKSLFNSGTLYVFDAAGNQLSPAAPPKENEVLFFQTLPYRSDTSKYLTESFQTANSLIVHKKLLSNWMIIGKIPFKELYASTHRVFIIMGICMFALFCIGCIISSRVARRIVQPIDQMLEVMVQSSQTPLPLCPPGNSYIETNMLIKGYNEMTEQVSSLIQLKLQQQSELDAERLRILQYQINPHFLYNTLDSIIALLKDHRYDDAIEMVAAMSALFRVALSHGDEWIPLDREVSHVENYLKIQKMRFGDLFSYDINIDSGMDSLYVPKLTLQPLVENALYHGIQPNGRNGFISVMIYRKGNNGVLEVMDDGVGLSFDSLDRIREQLSLGQSKDGFGLLNVHKRLQIFFNKKAGVELDSYFGFGTKARIIIPIMEEAVNDENHDCG